MSKVKATPQEIKDYVSSLIRLIESGKEYKPLEQRKNNSPCATTTRDFGYSGNTPISRF